MRGRGRGWETWLGWLDVRDFGGGLNKSAAVNAAAFQQAVYVAQNEGGGIVFFRPGEYLTDTQLNVTAGVSLWGPGAIIKQADGANQTAVINIDVVDYESLVLNIGVDGNKANNTAIEGIVIKDLRLAHHDINVFAKNCDVGVVIEGNTETSFIFATTTGCDVGVLERAAGALTPDENTIFISGHTNGTHYEKQSNGISITSVIHFACEGSTAYAAIIDGGLTIINGELRGCDDGGISLLSGSAVFNSPMLYGDGVGWGLLCGEDADNIFGSLRTNGFDGGAWIKACTLGSLYLSARSCDSLPALKLGDFAGVTQARRFTLLPGSVLYTATGPTLLFDNSYSCEVDVNNILAAAGDEVEFGEGSSRDVLKVPAEFNGLSYTVNASATYPAIEICGYQALPQFADVDATPSILMGNAFLSGTAAETITDFRDQAPGKVFTIISKAAITFDTTGTNIYGSSVDIVTASGDITQWICETGSKTRLVSWIDMSKDNSVTT